MFHNMSVKMKVMGGFFISILFTLIIGTTALIIMSNFGKASSFVHEVITVRHVRTYNIRAALNTASEKVFLMYQDVANDTPEDIADMQGKLAEYVRLTNTLTGGTDPQSAKKAKEVAALLDDVINNDFVSAIKNKDQDAARDLYYSIIHNAFEEGDAAMDRISEGHIRLSGNAIEENTSSTPFYATAILLILAVIFAVMIAFGVTNYTIRNLNTALKTAKAVADGDLTVKIGSSGTDEFAVLINATEKMRSQLNQLVTQIKSSVSQAVNDFAEIHDITDRITESTRSTESKAVTVAAASDEMVSTTTDIAKNCQSAATMSDEATSTTQRGVSEVQNTINNIQSQVEKTNNDAEQIKTLVDTSQKVSTIVQTIEDIASQTNLLALNAAIEAARAGEAGKGFAVVADEVRALASRTASSTQDIIKMVSQIQSDANTANNSMMQSLSNMDALASQTSSVQEMLHAIIEQVSNVNGQITQIATAAEQQTTATSEISSNMQGITTESQTLSELVNSAQGTVNGSVENLNSLHRMVDRFKV